MDFCPPFMSLGDLNQPLAGGFDDFIDYDPYNTSQPLSDEPSTAFDGTLGALFQAQPLETTLPDLALPDFELPELDAGSPYPTLLDLQDDDQDATDNVVADASAPRDFNAWLDLQVLNSLQPTEFDTLIASLDDHLLPPATLEADACNIDFLDLSRPAPSIAPQASSIFIDDSTHRTGQHDHLAGHRNDAKDIDCASQAAQHVQSPSPTSPDRRDSPVQKSSPCHPDYRSAELAGVEVKPVTTYDTPLTPLSVTTPKRPKKWTTVEDDLLIKLRGQGMKWEDIAKQFPHRSSITCRLRYQDYLQKQAPWDEEKKNKLAGLYARYKDQMWQMIAGELEVPWRSAESMHWVLGEAEMTARANAPVFQHETTTGLEAAKRRRSSRSSAGRDHDSKIGRAVISPDIQEILEDHFKSDPYVDGYALDKLCRKTSLSKKQIRTWYANARTRKDATGELGELKTHESPPLDATAFLRWFSDWTSGTREETSARRSSSLARSDASMRSLGSAMSCSSVRSVDPRGPRRGRKGWMAPSYDPAVLLPPITGMRPSSPSKMKIGEGDLEEPGSPCREEPVRKLPDMERALSNWARNHQKQGLPLSDTIIRDKARFFAQTTGNSDNIQKANSTSWLENFKQKNHLMGTKPTGTAEGSEETSPPSNVQTPCVTPSNDQDGSAQAKAWAKAQSFRRASQAFRQAVAIFCTWPGCNKRFSTRSAWARHEEATHYCPFHWVCCMRDSSSRQATLSTCFICEQQNVSQDHIIAHEEFKKCRHKDQESRTFLRQDHLIQHIKGTHLKTDKTLSSAESSALARLASAWQTNNPSLSYMALHCGFCDAAFGTWKDRQDHVFAHFQADASGHCVGKADWKELAPAFVIH